MYDIDIKILNIFYCIYRFKSISEAANYLNLSQPTLSNLLNKLRKYYNDPLFLRVGNEMLPTDLSKQLFPLVGEVLQKFELVLNFSDQFDEINSQLKFNIAMTDVSHLVLLPKISTYLKQHAPGIQLEVHSITLDTADKMKSGEIDLAIGFLPNLEPSFYQQKLFEQYYVVIASKDHPRLQDNKISIEQYLNEKHIDVDAGAGHYSLEQVCNNLGLKRSIVMKLPSYLGVGLVVQESESIATVPYYLSEVLLARGNLQILAAPIDFPTYAIKQFWHVSSNNKKSQKWFRNMSYEILSK